MESITIYAYSTAKLPLSLAECHEILWPERLEQLSRFPEQSQQHSLAGDLLALMAYRAAYPADAFPPERAVTPEGKPYFPARPAFHYSISHSGEWVVCAVGAVPGGGHSGRTAGAAGGVPGRCRRRSRRSWMGWRNGSACLLLRCVVLEGGLHEGHRAGAAG